MVVTIGFFLCAVGLHCFLCHVPLKGTMLTKFLISATPLGIGLMAYVFSVLDSYSALACMLIYACACEFYIFLFSFITSSISGALIMNVLAGNNSRESLCTEYCGDMMLGKRIQRMKEVGLLIENQSTLQASKKTNKLLKFFSLLRLFFRNYQARLR